MKTPCPFCAEPIPSGAAKCPSCGELLDANKTGGGAIPDRPAGMSTAMILLIVAVVALVLCGCLGIAAAIAIPNLIEARKHGNEAAAIGALKTMNTAQAIFREGDKDYDELLDYGTLAELSASTMIDGVLGSGMKQGYVFDCAPSRATPEFLWFAIANPVVPGTTGDRYFATNHAGVIWYSTTRAFTMNTDTCDVPTDAIPVGR
jgi:hypothetical protein